MSEPQDRAAARRFNLSRGLPPSGRPIGRNPFGEGEAAARSRKLRSLGIALLLVGFCVLIFFVTMARIGASLHHG